MGEWLEYQRISTAPDLTNISCITVSSFDPNEELMWVGNGKGYISSYFPQTGQRHTSYRGHLGAVKDMALFEQGIASIDPTSVRLNHREGLVKWNLSCDMFKNLTCLSTCNIASCMELVVGGRQDKMVVVNLQRGQVTQSFNSAEYIHMKRAKYICGGTLTGAVHLMDPKTMRVEHAIQAHTGMITDMDVSGHTLITCGYSRRGDQLVVDPMVKIYDLRTNRTLSPISFTPGAKALRIHPRTSSLIHVVSQTGHFQICDLNQPNVGFKFYNASVSGYVTTFEISNSAELICIGDMGGILHTWSSTDEPKVNLHSNVTELPPPYVPSDIKLADDSPLSLIGMPYYIEPLLSVWPARKVYLCGQKPPEIEPEVLNNMNTIDFVGYAPNPGTRRRNQSGTDSTLRENGIKVPKFRSEQQRERVKGVSVTQPKSLEEESSSLASLKTTMPKYYRKVDIKYSKFGIEDFDFGFYNRTEYGGLESHIPNTYVNSILQMLYFTPMFKDFATWHIRTQCMKEYCLYCELGFLFRMLDGANGKNCNASNFLKAFSKNELANQLRLVEVEKPMQNVSYFGVIQEFKKYILNTLHQECNIPVNLGLRKLELDGVDIIRGEDTTSEKPSSIEQLYGMNFVTRSRCLCKYELSENPVTLFSVDLNYPKNSNKRIPFSTIFQNSLTRETQKKMWCSRCRKYQNFKQKQLMKDLPYIISINTAVSKESEEFWRNKDIKIYDSKEKIYSVKPWLPLRLAIILSEGKCRVVEMGPTENDIVPYLHKKEVVKSNTTYGIFDLHSVISEISFEKDHNHLISQIRVSLQNGESNQENDREWYLFNDFLVKRIIEHEVTHTEFKWKVPATLQFVRRDIHHAAESLRLPSPMDLCGLFKNLVLSSDHNTYPEESGCMPLGLNEVPSIGYLCGIDSEFVALRKEELEFRSDGTRATIRPSTLALARVSVLRGHEPFTPFIDDYIAIDEPIEDYLTEFSGILPEDLQPGKTKHNLIPLKAAYKKLRILVDMGCIFVGHGLDNDFRTINIKVPMEQVIDTVEIFHLKDRHRKISLRFLAWYLLKDEIQREGHSSVEDASASLAIYHKYLELKKEGRFEEVLRDIYKEGQLRNWKIPPSI